MLMKISDALSPEVRAELMRPAQIFDPRMAEVGAGQPTWSLVEVWSREAEKHLAKRGFGLYVPEQRLIEIRRGRKVDARKSMFPGYALVFMWLTDANWGRVVQCEDVKGFVGPLHDEEVDLIRAVENAQKFPRRSSRHHSNHREKGKLLHAMRKRRWEEWLEEIRSPCSEKRNQALRNLLRLF